MLYRERTLQTPHGELHTPVLFPVSNIGTRSSDNTPDYTRVIPELNTAMVNGRAIRQRVDQWERISDDSRLRAEMEVDDSTIIFADSGGYQFHRTAVDITPEEVLGVQTTIGADLLGTLDIPLDRGKEQAGNQERISRSIRYALQASDLHDGPGLLLASVHGLDPRTVENTIAHLERHGCFDGYAIGSLVPIRTDYRKVVSLILAARRSTDKHLHVYGLGGLVYQPLLLYLGVDSFDSSSFIRSAGKRRYLIPGLSGHRVREFETMRYPPCPCPICCDTDLATIRGSRTLLTMHNLWALTTELRTFRFIVHSGRDVEEYLALRFEGNPVTKRAFEGAKQQIRGFA